MNSLIWSCIGIWYLIICLRNFFRLSPLRVNRLTWEWYTGTYHIQKLNLDMCQWWYLAFSIQVHQDMTLPISHYYIFTGHNSYLTGNQLSSDCSDIPIIKALQRGVRVIELDMWPNSTKDNVDILHGRYWFALLGAFFFYLYFISMKETKKRCSFVQKNAFVSVKCD